MAVVSQAPGRVVSQAPGLVAAGRKGSTNQYAQPLAPSSGSWVTLPPPPSHWHSQTQYASESPSVALTAPPRGQKLSSLSLPAGPRCCPTECSSRIGTSFSGKGLWQPPTVVVDRASERIMMGAGVVLLLNCAVLPLIECRVGWPLATFQPYSTACLTSLHMTHSLKTNDCVTAPGEDLLVFMDSLDLLQAITRWQKGDFWPRPQERRHMDILGGQIWFPEDQDLIWIFEDPVAKKLIFIRSGWSKHGQRMIQSRSGAKI